MGQAIWPGAPPFTAGLAAAQAGIRDGSPGLHLAPERRSDAGIQAPGCTPHLRRRPRDKEPVKKTGLRRRAGVPLQEDSCDVHFIANCRVRGVWERLRPREGLPAPEERCSLRICPSLFAIPHSSQSQKPALVRMKEREPPQIQQKLFQFLMSLTSVDSPGSSPSVHETAAPGPAFNSPPRAGAPAPSARSHPPRSADSDACEKASPRSVPNHIPPGVARTAFTRVDGRSSPIRRHPQAGSKT